MFNKKSLKLLAVSTAVVGLVGCGATTPPIETNLPDWVAAPYIEGGIAATECVPYSGDMSMDKAEVTALGRAALAKQLGIKVKAMDKTYKRKVASEGGNVTGGTFESVSKQVSEQHLKGSSVRKANIITIEEKRQYCAMVAIDPVVTKQIFEALIEESGSNVDPQSESILYEEFKSFKAQEELAAE